MPSLELQVRQLEAEITSLRTQVCTLISWIGQSANSPLSVNDCNTLIKAIEGKGKANAISNRS
jgi:hypothetical protein